MFIQTTLYIAQYIAVCSTMHRIENTRSQLTKASFAIEMYGICLQTVCLANSGGPTKEAHKQRQCPGYAGKYFLEKVVQHFGNIQLDQINLWRCFNLTNRRIERQMDEWVAPAALHILSTLTHTYMCEKQQLLFHILNRVLRLTRDFGTMAMSV